MDPYILKSIIQGTYLAIYSTIKPGGHHRLKIDKETHIMFTNTLSVVDYLIESIEYGEKIRRGDLTIASAGIGRLIAKALREAYRWNGGKVYPSYIVPQLIYSLALSHSGIDSVIKDSGKLKKSLDLVLSINKWSEVKQVVEVLKSIHRHDMYEHLTSSGISHIAGIEGQINLYEVFRILGSRWYGFQSLDIYNYKIVDHVKTLLNYYKKLNDPENAVIALYLELVKEHMPEWALKHVSDAWSKGLMGSKDGAKKLFELDNLLRKNNISFNQYTGLLAIIVSLGVFEGLRF